MIGPILKNQITLKIIGQPIAKKRPRFVKRGGHTVTYNPQETEEGMFRHEMLRQLPATWRPLKGSLSMSCRFLFARPKSHFGTGRNRGKLKPSAPLEHTQKPDLDNLVKFIKDCMNRHIYQDDKQIVRLDAQKRWCSDNEEPMTEVCIIEL